MPYNLKWRVFKRVPRGAHHDRLTLGPNALRFTADGEPERYALLKDGATDVSPVAQLAVDRSGFLASANQAARSEFGLGAADIGRPLQDLEISYRPAELRDALDSAQEERRMVSLGLARWRTGTDAERVYEVEVTPLFAAGAAEPLGASVTFNDVTAFAKLEEQHKQVERELETAYEELQSTVEELETTNEELQSTNEELETTNEELQSTNEELETMNEELQSTNDELEAMNEAQTERATELDRANLFLEGILGSLGIGVVVLDSDQLIQLWNSSAADLWGLRDHEVVGTHFLALDVGLPVEKLKEPIREALGDEPKEVELAVDAVNRRGRKFRCQVRILPLQDGGKRAYGVLLLMSEDS
jgi:two-component system, chemotaxis family, CheB/CheR fusion protein